MTPVEVYFKETFRDRLSEARKEVHALARCTPDPMEFIAKMADVQLRFQNVTKSHLDGLIWTEDDKRFLKYLHPNWFPRYMNDSESYEP